MKVKLLRAFQELSDAELVEMAIAGDENSFEEIVRRYQRSIASYVYKMIGDYETSLDITQEVFIKVYNNLTSYSSDYKFSTWIYKIAHNATIDYLRRNYKDQETDSETSFLTLESRLPTPERESEAKECLEEIKAVIECLPPSYRELILLRHSHDLSYEEIAEVTSLPIGTVKNRLFRARAEMKKLLSKRGFNF
ncbi:MAG: sigma-70 family RNA polymerase sigma factor [Acidobacteria bacterium]|jgi:RNA polymerase sigma-70 factor (ECF subfamily)|nr:MAG: sigma-70 family RNA polymerase sigma factor [Acidobacteriota bacterium]GIU81547.1 MAG: RNA polymerase sigma factor [Pyrinomonadaceae bacterium]